MLSKFLLTLDHFNSTVHSVSYENILHTRQNGRSHPLVQTADANADTAFMEESEDQPECLSRDELRRRIHNLEAQQVRSQTRYVQEEKLTGNFKAA